jgi:hypothetical protein
MREQAIDLPPISDEERKFLHYNPNTDDLVEWVQAYAAAAAMKERERCSSILDECAANAYERNAMRENGMWVALAADMRKG